MPILFGADFANSFCFPLLTFFNASLALAQQDLVLDEDAFADTFLELTTTRIGEAGPHPVQKWSVHNATIAVAYEPYHDDLAHGELRDSLMSVRDTIFEETGFRFSIPRYPDAVNVANVFLLFGSPAELQVYAEISERRLDHIGFTDRINKQLDAGEPICAIAVGWAEDTSIANVAIAIDARENVTNCITQMMFRSMGFWGQLEGPAQHLELEDDAIGEFERLALRTLYADQIQTGATPTDEDVRQIVNTLRAEEW